MNQYMRYFLLVALAITATGRNACAEEWASLSGQFVFGAEGTPIPKRVALKVAQGVCGKQPIFDESLVLNPKNRGIKNVVLWAYKPNPEKIHPGYAHTAKDKVRIDNVNCRFKPHVITVRTEQTLQIGNLDPFGHNAMASFLKNRPINPLIPAGQVIDCAPLKRAELIPIRIGCSIHPWMQGVVMVQDHPYMAITDEDGKFKIENLPAGKLTLKVWHEKIGYVKTVQIDGDEETWRKGRYAIDLSDGKSQQHQYLVPPALFAKK